MKVVIGWDIGGANTKISFLKTEGGKITKLRTASEYFPFWREEKKKFPDLLRRLKNKVAGETGINAMGLTMTAELSDTFQTKREGVNYVLDQVKKEFLPIPIYVLDVKGRLRTIDGARSEPLQVAAANWIATGLMVAKEMKECLIIDVGSTTTSIIPIINGKIATKGKNDLEKLMNGELIYTGALRTNVASLVEKIPLSGGVTRVSSELFALSGDVHLLLGNIRKDDYNTETADGRGKSRRESLSRLARVVCADTETLSEQEIMKIAKYVYEMQVKKIAGGIKQVLGRTKLAIKKEVPAIVAGLGSKFLAQKAAEKAGIKKVIFLDKLVGRGSSFVAPSTGVALLVVEKIEKVDVTWNL